MLFFIGTCDKIANFADVMAKRKLYGLVGRVLGHSFSRSYFTEKFNREGIDADYLNFELPDISDLRLLVDRYPELCGFNVTIPYKQSIIPLLDGGLDDEARSVGAVNVVRVLPDGRMRGYNTDAPAFAESLRCLLSARPVPSVALVLGTGGASRAVAAALSGMGIAHVLVSRMAGEGQLTYDDLTPDVVGACELVVNTTPLGMWPLTDDAPRIPYDALTPRHACFDLVYNPNPTLFMRLAAARGAATCSGLGMLHLQAEGSWKIWSAE